MQLLRLLAAAALIAATATPASAQAGPDVKRVEVEGLRVHTADEVRARMSTHVGRAFSRETLDTDIRRLFSTGWFADVRLSERSILTGPGAAVIILEVLENDVIREVRFVGNRHFKNDELTPDAILKSGEYFAPWKVKLDEDRIRDKYLVDGYAFVKVEGTAASTGRGTIVTLTVREGPRVRVRSIEIHGTELLDPDQMEKEMQTKGTTIWNFPAPPEYQALQLAEDLKALTRFARGEGFLDAKVYLRDLEWNTERTRITIHIQVEEGIQYMVDRVDIEGAERFGVNELYHGMRVRPGTPFALRQVNRDEDYLLDKYRGEAYVDVEVAAIPRYLSRRGHVNLTWKIREGGIVYVRRIDFVGHHRTREKVLRREMLLLPGEEFNKLLLDTSMDRLRATRFFEPTSPQLFARAWGPVRDPVIVVEVLPGGDRNERDLLIHVQEGRTGNLQFGGTYSDEGGFSGKLAVTQNNFDLFDLPKSIAELFNGDGFAGAGQIARIDLEPGFKRSRYEASFTEPWLLDYPVSMTVSGRYYDEDLGYYTERRLAGEFDLGQRWDDFADTPPGTLDSDLAGTFLGGLLQGISYAAIHLPGYFLFDDHVVRGYSIKNFWQRNYSVGIGYRIARINIRDVNDDSPTDLKEVQGLSYLSSITFHASIDRRNSRVFPSQGFVSTVSYEYAGYPLGGYYDFWKINYRHQAFSTLWTRKDGGKIIFETDLVGGFGQEHYYSLDLPIFERYYAGGSSLRGFEYRTISPKEGRHPIGGRVMTLASAEVTFPIIRPEIAGRDIDILRGAFFTDWGTVVADPKDFGYFRWSAGFGVRLQIPLGGTQIIPLTLDFGYPLKRQHGDRRQTLHIGFDFGF